MEITLGQQYNVEEKPTVMLYTYINRHAAVLFCFKKILNAPSCFISHWPNVRILDAAAELERNPVSKHQIQREYGDEPTDAGWDGRTRLARPNSQARTRTGKYSFSP